MKTIENNPLEELQIRAENLQIIIEAAEMELGCVLRDIEKLTEKRQIGFKFGNNLNVKKKRASKSNELPPHNMTVTT